MHRGNRCPLLVACATLSSYGGEGLFSKPTENMVLLLSLFILKFLDNLPLTWYEIVMVAGAIKFAEFVTDKQNTNEKH